MRLYGYRKGIKYGESDPWGFYLRNCTSAVAWWLHERNGFDLPFFDDASVGQDRRNRGYTVNMIPAPGAVAWWQSADHVAWVESVSANGSQVTVEQYNQNYTGGYSRQTIATNSVSGCIHFKDLPTKGSPPPPSPAGSISALVHGSRVNLKWGAASGASQYRVSRDGVLLATVSGTTYLDIQVSPKQAYTYSVVALNSTSASAPVTLYVQTTIEAADRAYLPTKNGPAICGRAGDQSSQYLVCNVDTPTGWTTSYSKPDDWGYASDRSWIANPDGTVSYCRRVGTGGPGSLRQFRRNHLDTIHVPAL